MTKDEFELAFRKYCENHGISYDPWDIAANWLEYQENPENFKYLLEQK